MALSTKFGLGPGHTVLNGDSDSLPQKGAQPPICGPFLLWPNGWMHQGATSYRGRPQLRRLCVRWKPSPPPQKGAEPPIFGPRLLWPIGCMNQDATWYRGKPRLTRHRIRWGPSSPPLNGHRPTVLGQFPLWPNDLMD